MKLKVENLSFSYGNIQVLHDISFDLGTGATALLGQNGAGKTTLFSLLSTATAVPQGSVSFTSETQTINSKKQIQEFRKRLAFVPQIYTPVRGLTVQEHVEYVSWLSGKNKQEVKKLANSAITTAQITHLKNRKSHTLSGGETRRMAIAGALACAPDLLLFDEPTAALDPQQKDAINKLINQLAEKHCLLVATHDLLQLEETYQHVIALRHGSKSFDGTTSDFLAPFSGDQFDRARQAFTHYAG